VLSATTVPSAMQGSGSSSTVYIQPGSSSGVSVGTSWQPSSSSNGGKGVAGTAVVTSSNLPAATGTVVTTGDAAAAAPQRVEYPGNMVNVPATAFDTGKSSWPLFILCASNISTGCRRLATLHLSRQQAKQESSCQRMHDSI
jgi:hypothetical protein